MEQQHSSTSKVTVEYHDPHDVYKLLAPGLIPRLPLHDLNWQSHSGPLRSIGTLHVELIRAGDPGASLTAPSVRLSDSNVRDDGFQTQSVGGRPASSETIESTSNASSAPHGPPGQRRHQIPGLRRTPYLKVLLVRCDDNDSYKTTVRSEVREWIKTHTPPSGNSKKSGSGGGGGSGSAGSGAQEAHDAFEWLILHVVIPNTAAATQPRSSTAKFESATDTKGASSRWRTGSTPLMEKFQSDFNGSGKGAVDRVAQIRIGINDVPYDHLPRVVPAVPTGYMETDHDARVAWDTLILKFKDLILTSFDRRVAQYEEDIKEKDAQRTLPGWNFCTFFILKEGLARGFENVGLVEDALVGYDELSVGLDSVVQELAMPGSAGRLGGALLSHTEELKHAAEKILDEALGQGAMDEEEAVDLQSKEVPQEQFDDIPISATKKAYRDMILANKVSVFEFRCYIFARQIALLLRLGNAVSTREELLAKLKEQQESVLHGIAPRAPPPKKQVEESENLGRLAEICRRALQFIPTVSQIMRQDIMSGLLSHADGPKTLDPSQVEVVDNMVASFAFSVAQQILAQTSTKALPIPPSTLAPQNADEPKSSIPEPKTMMHPARGSSLAVRTVQQPPVSPGVFPGPGRDMSELDDDGRPFAKAGLEELGARRADLYLVSRSILDGLGKKRGWTDGWDAAPLVGDPDDFGMEEISLDDDDDEKKSTSPGAGPVLAAGIGSRLLLTALDNDEDFYRLYEILTDKAMRHFMVAGHDHAVHANMSDLAVLKYHMKDYRAASSLFCMTTPFFGESGWSLLELSMLVMYSRCLKELQSKQDYIRVALKLMTKASSVEKEWLRQKSSSLAKGLGKATRPDMSCIAEAVGTMSDLVASLPSEAKVPLESFFTNVEFQGLPQYHDGQDSCEVAVQLTCLLPDGIDIDAASLRVASTDGGPAKELWFTMKKDVPLSRGAGTIKLECKSVVPGPYSIDHLRLSSGNLVLHFDRHASQPPPPDTDIFSQPQVMLYQRDGALDVALSATKHTILNKNNGLDLTLSTGWNDLASCEVSVKPATGGLRLLTTEATLVEESSNGATFAKPPESGIFYFGALGAQQSLAIRFPFSLEQDVNTVSLKFEVTYKTTAGDTYFLAKFLSVPVALAVGVNVQDIFKHDALFSRFSVSSANSSPLRIFETELLESELFESSPGAPASGTLLVFPKQSANFLYKVRRKPGVSRSTKRSSKVMHLKLYYSQLHAEIEELFSLSVTKLLGQSPSLVSLSRTVQAIVVDHVRNGLDALDLERAALLGAVATGFMSKIQWAVNLKGLATLPDTGEDAGAAIATVMNDWQTSHPKLPIPTTAIIEKSSILIPVEIPSIPVVHTADIRLNPSVTGPVPSSVTAEQSGATTTPIVSVNQVLQATLHLKWTRLWDTSPPRKEDDYQEFSYDVTAPPETWLLGGRRKGHFVIPYSSLSDVKDEESWLPISSTPETEASIPLVLIPQREGWLPYPAVDIREVPPEGQPEQQQQQQAHHQGLEVDWKNSGETMRVVGGRAGVTVSLDASGPGGGPLLLSVDRVLGEGARLIT